MSKSEPLQLINTGVPNLDTVLGGGIPLYSVNIIAGPSGSGKTILTQQIMFSNCQSGVKGIFFTTLSEPTFKMIRYQQQFDYFDLDQINRNIFYVDLGQVLRNRGLEEALLTIGRHVEEKDARFIAIDSFKAIHDLASTRPDARRFGYDLAVGLASWSCTSFLVGEYTESEILSEPIFAVADGIFFMTNPRMGMQNVRRLNLSKMRGMNYSTGDHPMRISESGITIFPRIKTPPEPAQLYIDDRADELVHAGVEGLDKMMGGGIPRSSVTLVAGGAGTGKTLISMHFLMEGVRSKEPGLFVTFQETPGHLMKIARGYGWDLDAAAELGLLKILYTSPVEMGVDEHTAAIEAAINEIGAQRVVIDSLMDIEIATPDKVRFKDYVYSLVNYFRAKGITTVLTNEIPELFGPLQLSAHGISFISDNVVLLRYVEIGSILRRGISVLKMRGRNHDKSVREFEISDDGLEILAGFSEWISVMSGQPQPFERSTSGPLRMQGTLENQILETLIQVGPQNIGQLSKSLRVAREDLRQVLFSLAQAELITVESENDQPVYAWKE